MRHIFSILLVLSLAFTSHAQVNIDSVSHINYQQLHQSNLNDIWGYVDETGIEYALVGGSKGTSVVSLENPSAPVELFWEPGDESVWRDLKTYGDFAYVTTEAESGLLIIDLGPLPGSSALTTTYYNGPVGQQWSSAHNLWIDENGYAYIFGANRGNGGVIILDIHTDPTNPIEVGVFDNWYVHDGYVRNDTMYLAHIEAGWLSVVDVTDKSNPVLLGTKTTPGNFSHNIWPSDNSQFVFTTDEISGGYLGAYDVTDPTNIKEVDRIQSSPGEGVIPHNVHVLGNYLVTSYYSDGVTVHDITHPHNMILVGQYDTYPLQTMSYDGCWGAYPFLPSGLLLATDITEGLFILQPTYVQAAYLEGLVTETTSGNPISNVDVQIIGHDQIDRSGLDGVYATGILTGGTYQVSYSKVGYYSQTHSVDLINGEISIKDVQLEPIPPFNLTVNVVKASDGTPVSNAKIRLVADLITHEGTTNALGIENFVLYYQEEYRVMAGKWSFITSCFDSLIDENTGLITIELESGYYDDFEFDFGWSSSGNAATGLWERGKPNGTSSGSNPSFDAEYDCGNQAYITGNSTALHPDVDDVDDGTAILISPVMDLSGYSDPYINYSRWFYCRYGSPEEDSMRIMIVNGFTTAWIDITGHDAQTELTWVPKSIRVLDHLSPTSSVQIIIRVSDIDPDVNITEGGIDYFHVSNMNVADIAEEKSTQLKVYPNPVTNELFVEYGVNEARSYWLTDLNGRLMKTGELHGGSDSIRLEGLSSGIYLLVMNGEVLKVLKD